VTTLASLDPVTVGREATDLVLQRVGRLSLVLMPGYSLDPGQCRGDTDLGLTVTMLTLWAQSGALGDWADHEDAADALLAAAEALYASPLGDWQPSDLDAAVDLPRDVDPSPVALVLACALSRLRIARGESVTLAELARLASVTGQRVRQLAGAGEIAAEGGEGRTPSRVEATEARRWLASRGLRGW
jgi:hypothetical protein